MKEIELCLEIIRGTEKAFEVSDDGCETSVWLPKSQVSTDQDCGPGDTIVFTIPEWLAEKSGLI